MDNRNTKIYNSYNANILQVLFVRYGVSKHYIRKCLAGNAHGIKPDAIRNDYVEMEKVIRNTLSELINNKEQ
jgi:hypothetical protein